MGTNLMVTMTAPAAATVRTDGSAAGKSGAASLFAGLLGQAMQGGDAAGVAAAAGLPLATGWFVLPAEGQAASPAFGATVEGGDAEERLLKLLAGWSDPGSGEKAGEESLKLAEMLAALLGTVTPSTEPAATLPAAEISDAPATDGLRLLTWLVDAADAADRQPLVALLRQLVAQAQNTDAGDISLPAGARLVDAVKAALHGQAAMPSAAGEDTAPAGTIPANAPRTAEPVLAETTGMARIAEARPKVRIGILPPSERLWRPVAEAAQATAPAEEESVPMPTANSPEQAASGLPADGEAMPVWMLRDAAHVPVRHAPTRTELPHPVPVRQFAEQFETFLVKRLTMHRLDGVAEARITLHPEHLGHVDIRLTVQNGQVTAQFVTQNGMARELLENQMAQLRTALQGHGLQVERMEVVQQTPTYASTSAFLQQQDRHPGSGDGRRRTFDGGRGNAYRDAVDFDAALERSAWLHDVYGSSINLTA